MLRTEDESQAMQNEGERSKKSAMEDPGLRVLLTKFGMPPPEQNVDEANVDEAPAGKDNSEESHVDEAAAGEVTTSSIPPLASAWLWSPGPGVQRHSWQQQPAPQPAQRHEAHLCWLRAGRPDPPPLTANLAPGSLSPTLLPAPAVSAAVPAASVAVLREALPGTHLRSRHSGPEVDEASVARPAVSVAAPAPAVSVAVEEPAAGDDYTRTEDRNADSETDCWACALWAEACHAAPDSDGEECLPLASHHPLCDRRNKRSACVAMLSHPGPEQPPSQPAQIISAVSESSVKEGASHWAYQDDLPHWIQVPGPAPTVARPVPISEPLDVLCPRSDEALPWQVWPPPSLEAVNPTFATLRSPVIPRLPGRVWMPLCFWECVRASCKHAQTLGSLAAVAAKPIVCEMQDMRQPEFKASTVRFASDMS
jgi:hypothetical protein